MVALGSRIQNVIPFHAHNVDRVRLASAVINADIAYLRTVYEAEREIETCIRKLAGLPEILSQTMTFCPMVDRSTIRPERGERGITGWGSPLGLYI
jgi:hypothetical protein